MRLACALLLATALCTPVLAEDETVSRIEDLNLGTYWYGAPLEIKDLRGKVVLVEIWGS